MSKQERKGVARASMQKASYMKQRGTTRSAHFTALPLARQQYAKSHNPPQYIIKILPLPINFLDTSIANTTSTNPRTLQAEHHACTWFRRPRGFRGSVLQGGDA